MSTFSGDNLVKHLGRILLLGLAMVAMSSAPASAIPITLNDESTVTFAGSSGSLAASAVFSLSSGTLTVVLTNTSAADVLVPANVLTALFFDISGDPALTPGSALLSGGSTVFFGSDGGGNVGGEWAYLNSLSGAPGGANQGISSAGFGLFGGPNLGGLSLDPPIAINGLNYGILSAGDNSATGNAPVTGGNPLIRNQVTFTLSGAGSSLTFNTNVSFQYGTGLTEPRITGDCVDCTQDAPEPTTLILLGCGLASLALYRRRPRARG